MISAAVLAYPYGYVRSPPCKRSLLNDLRIRKTAETLGGGSSPTHRFPIGGAQVLSEITVQLNSGSSLSIFPSYYVDSPCELLAIQQQEHEPCTQMISTIMVCTEYHPLKLDQTQLVRGTQVVTCMFVCIACEHFRRTSNNFALVHQKSICNCHPFTA